MRRVLLLLACLFVLRPEAVLSQTRPVEGLRERPARVHALVGARVVVQPGEEIANGTVVLRDGVIEAVGEDVEVPADARVWELAGRTIYPGFIDAHSDLGMDEPRTDASERGAAYWNPQIQTFIDAASEYVHGDDRAEELRAQGFTLAQSVPQLGIFRGRTAVVSLGEGSNNRRIVAEGPAQSVSFSRSNDLGGGYPTSAMGSIALIRQTLLDADWYARAHAAYRAAPAGLERPEADRALAALSRASEGGEPLLFEVSDEDQLQRVLRIAEEFPIRPWLRGSGDEYRVLDALDGFEGALILPVDFPSKPEVGTPEAALSVGLTQLRRWYLAPENPGRVAGAGIPFAFTADELEEPESFLPNVRKAVERGLDPDVALDALTGVPAGWLGVGDTHGSLAPGKVANLVVADGDLFRDDDARVLDVWVDGGRFPVEDSPTLDIRGDWIVAGAGMEGRMELAGSAERPSGSLTVNGETVRLSSVSVQPEARRVRIQLPDGVGGDGSGGSVHLTATFDGDELQGWGEFPDGRLIDWRGERVSGTAQAALPGEEDGDGESSPPPPPEGEAPSFLEVRPDQDFGRVSQPDQPEHLLVRNATIWTMGPEGRLEGADLLVSAGRVAEVGVGLEAPEGAVVIDASGKHVSPGMIDGHIHSGGSGGVNESGSAIVPEVRMGDVITANNSWMYRQLAGGLTTAHLMHGSANPIGGQNQHMKMRWGASPEELKLDGAPRTVKFALGENPTRRSDRYPDTRMGVEQIIRDHFVRAREYEAEWQRWEETGEGIPPRRDLRLEAVLDILNGEILVMSHSYRQDEILMLMRLAEEFGFRVAAFHHAVEAYKVAPELREHGAGAFVWSDWSSFKIEAYDATMFNARLLNEAGVTTSLHSDNSQLASRMNWDAGKMVRVGMEEEDALALVTINTARLLGIDDRVGSLEEGKDADFVIWSGNPLSQFTRAEQTWVDGRRYFDLGEDRQLRDRVVRERADLVRFARSGS